MARRGLAPQIIIRCAMLAVALSWRLICNSPILATDGCVLEAPLNRTVTDRFGVRFAASGVPHGEPLCVWDPAQPGAVTCGAPAVAGPAPPGAPPQVPRLGRAGLLLATAPSPAALGTHALQVTCGRGARNETGSDAVGDAGGSSSPGGSSGRGAIGGVLVTVTLAAPDPTVTVVLNPSAAEAAAGSYGAALRRLYQQKIAAAQRKCQCSPGARGSESNKGGEGARLACERLPPGALGRPRLDGWRDNGRQHEWLRARLFPDVYGGTFVEVGAGHDPAQNCSHSPRRS